jgi:hypothetical protein
VWPQASCALAAMLTLVMSKRALVKFTAGDGGYLMTAFVAAMCLPPPLLVPPPDTRARVLHTPAHPCWWPTARSRWCYFWAIGWRTQ